MPFSIRPHRRFPVHCHVTYHAGLSEGHGTVWNLSCARRRPSEDLPMRSEEMLSLTVPLPDEPRIEVLERKGGALYYG